jgi:hypothetical protein
MKRLTAALACLALLLVAAPAGAAKPKPLHYEGETDGGEPVAFTLKGKSISAIDASILTTCVPTHGTPMTYSTAFNPPGSFVLGGPARKASTVEYMPYKGDVTKYFTVHVSRLGKHAWKADLDVNFSYEEVTFGTFSEIVQRFYICQGNDHFTFKA